MSTLHVLENDVWQVGFLPETGMSTAFGRIRHAGAFLDFMRPTAEASYGKSSSCASFLLAPWSNRIANGVLRFAGQSYQLRITSPDGTAMHGVVRNYPWQVLETGRDHVRASFASDQHQDVNFPFRITVRFEAVLEGPRFINRLSIRNESRQTMPAGLGHHPYFQRALLSADDEVQLEIPCSQYFPAQQCIPTGPAIPVDARLDFQRARTIGSVFIDDCLTGRLARRPITFSYPQSNVSIALAADPIFEQIVLYAPVGATYFAVEPVTNANDGFNLLANGIRGSGVFVLEPGEERTAAFTLERRDS